jgi:ABC-type polysaccharide/polyol phosphate transport system ATPase subunit
MIDAIRISNLSKRFRVPHIADRSTLKDVLLRTVRQADSKYVEALSDVSFNVEAGSMLGIIGRNGSGKTTLMRIIGGIMHPDSGMVIVEGQIAPLLTLGTTFHPDLSGRECARVELLALRFTPKQLPPLLDRIADFAEIGDFFEAPVRTYSAGMTMRLAFSIAMCVDPDVLLLDEILAVGDEAFALKCLNRINDFRAAQKTIVLVTHDSTIVEKWCDLALWLDRGKVAGFGEPQAVVAAYHNLNSSAAG